MAGAMAQSLLDINSMSLADAAATYAELGYKVFPLQPGTKLPFKGFMWSDLATSDVNVVRSWWQQYPHYNIALVCGEASGVDALDLDTKKGQDGVASFKSVVGDFHQGPIQRTPTGGLHYLMQHQPGLLNFTRKGPKGGMDLRTEGGYIVVAPSTVEGTGYQWLQAGPLPPMPEPIVKLGQESGGKQAKTPLPTVPERLPELSSLNLKEKHLNYLLRGDAEPWGGDQSSAIFAAALALYRSTRDPGVTWGLIESNEHVIETAYRHRGWGSHEARMSWVWDYCVAKAIHEVDSSNPANQFQPVPGGSAPEAPVATCGLLLPGDVAVDRYSLSPDWLVKGVLERGQVGFLYGDSQSLKSYLMVDLAMSIVTGSDWHGHAMRDAGRVIYLAGEGNRILARRALAWCQQHGHRKEAMHDALFSERGLDLMSAEGQQTLNDSVHYWGPPKLIVVDTVSTNAIMDENSAADASRLIQVGYQISGVFGCTVLFVHHTGKADKGTIRGSSVFLNNSDFVYRMERHDSHRIITQFHIEKLKGAEVPREPVVFEAEKVALFSPSGPVHNEDGEPVTELLLRRGDKSVLREAAMQRDVSRLPDLQARVFNVVKEALSKHWTITRPGEGLLREELLEAYRVSAEGQSDYRRSNFDRVIDSLLNRGLLRQETRGEHVIIKMKDWNGR